MDKPSACSPKVTITRSGEPLRISLLATAELLIRLTFMIARIEAGVGVSFFD